MFHSWVSLLAVVCCAAGTLASAVCYGGERTISGQVLGDDGKGLANAVVFVESPAGPARDSTPSAIMDQYNKTFVPEVLPVAVGTVVKFPNRDQIRHHVYSFSRAKRFELPLYKGEEAQPVVFDKAGVVKIGCNIHDWMSAVILVVPNEHYALTDEHGRFKLTGLDAGAYTITVWHARSKQKTEELAQQVQVANEDPQISFRLSLLPARPRPAVRGTRWD